MEGALTIYLSSPSSTQPLRHRKLIRYTGILSTVEEIIIVGMGGGGFLQSSHPDIAHLLYISSDIMQSAMVDDDVVLDAPYKYQYQYDSFKTRGEKIDIDGTNMAEYTYYTYEYTSTRFHKHSKSSKDLSNQWPLGSVGMIIAGSVSMMVGIAIGVRQKSTDTDVDDSKNALSHKANGDIESYTYDLGDASISANEFNSTNGQSGD